MTQSNQTKDSGAQQSFGALHLAARQRKQKGGAVLPVLVALVVGYLLFRFLGWQLVLAAVAGIVLLLALLIEEKLMAAVAAVVAAAALLAHCHKDEAPEAPPVVQQPQVSVPAQPQASVPAQQEASAPAQPQVPEQTEQKPAPQPGSAENVDVKAEGLTALMRAAIDGRFDSVKDLVERGANVNMRADNGGTALSFAAEKGHLDIVKFLVEHGANDMYTPMEGAAKRGHVPVVKYFLENTDAAKSQENMARVLIAAINEFYSSLGLDRNEKLSPSANLTHNRYKKLSPSAIEITYLLIDAGAPVMTYVGGSYDARAFRKKYGRASPWSRAWTIWGGYGLLPFAKSSVAKVIQYMVAHGADVNAPLDWIDHRYTGQTHPIMLAVMRRDEDAVKFLLDAGAQVNVRATGELDLNVPWESVTPNWGWIQGLTPLGKVYREMDRLRSKLCGSHLCCINDKCESEELREAMDEWKAIEKMLKAAGAHE